MKNFLQNSTSKFLLLIALIILGVSGYVNAQNSSEEHLPIPELETIVRSSEEEAEDAVGYATITAKIPEDDMCECGAVFEVKRAESNEWVVLAVFSPEETGDEHAEYGWSYIANYLEIGKDYDVRIKIFDRQGEESEYGTKRFTMKPETEAPCSDGQFANVTKEKTGTGEHALILLAWDKVCKEEQEANRYKVYKNGQEFRETDNGATNIAITGEPRGDTWKIEAYGDEPPNNDPAVVRTCEEMIAKMNARPANIGGNTGTNLKKIQTDNGIVRCQRFGNWLRAIVEWNPYTPQTPYTPTGWMTYSIGYGNAGVPFLNYVRGLHYISQNPIQAIDNGYGLCAINVNQTTNQHPRYRTDPWNQTDWQCYNELAPNGQSVIYRYWVNFDLTSVGSGGNSLWPVETSFTY